MNNPHKYWTMVSQLYYCCCEKNPFQSKSALAKHASASGCNPVPIPKKRKVDTSPSEDFLDAIPDDMKDVIPKWCREDRCFIDNLGYGIKGGDKISCKKHSDGLVEVGHLCTFRGCVKRGHMNVPQTRYKFCSGHLNELLARGLPAEDIKRPKKKECSHEGCHLSPSFDGNKFCEAHSPTGVSDDRRVFDTEGCFKKRPIFGFPGCPRTRCAEHKENGMYSRKICIFPDCMISASYGPMRGVVSHCKKHKGDGHTLINNPTCGYEACAKQPAFGAPGTKKPSRCKEHAPDGFIDVRNKRCAKAGCDKRATAICVSHRDALTGPAIRHLHAPRC